MKTYYFAIYRERYYQIWEGRLIDDVNDLLSDFRKEPGVISFEAEFVEQAIDTARRLSEENDCSTLIIKVETVEKTLMLE